MKIRLAIVDDDRKYAERLLNYYANRYSDKLELSYFTSVELFKENLLSKNMDAVLISEHFQVDMTGVSSKMLTAYFTESLSIDSIHNVKAICKYQKPDLIYKEILRLFSEYETGGIAYRIGDANRTMIEVFMSASGGAGATCLAVAYAKRLADKGIRTLYLNLEPLPSTNHFMEGEGNGTFDDVIYALKSKKPNLTLKLESLVRQDNSGVYYFASSDNPITMQELKDEDVGLLLEELQTLGSYNRIVVDSGLDFKGRMKLMAKIAYRFAVVAEQSELSMGKLGGVSKLLHLLESSKEIDISTKLVFICNKSQEHKEVAYDGEIPIKQYIPEYRNGTSKQIVAQLAGYPIFEGNKVVGV